jgi:hypothetical protein
MNTRAMTVAEVRTMPPSMSRSEEQHYQCQLTACFAGFTLFVQVPTNPRGGAVQRRSAVASATRSKHGRGAIGVR